MAFVASQLIDEVTAYAQSDSPEDAREMCADGTYFPNNLRICCAPYRYRPGEGLILSQGALENIYKDK